MEKFRKAQQQLHASQGSEHDWNLLQTCIALLEHIGDFRLKLSELEKTIVASVQQKKNEVEEGCESIAYICSNYKISTKRELNDFQKLVDNSRVLSSFDQRAGIFASIFDAIKPICEYVHDTTLALIFAPIDKQLKCAQLECNENAEFGGNDLPDYSFAPQEFITVIGQVRMSFFKKLLLKHN